MSPVPPPTNCISKQSAPMPPEAVANVVAQSQSQSKTKTTTTTSTTKLAGVSSRTPVRDNTTIAAASTITNSRLKRPRSTASGKPPLNPGGGSGSTTTTTQQTKKRPYRRTKRPKNYCDKSTVTTVTTPTRTSGDGSDPSHNTGSDGINVYDAVLGECEDLLRASTEAQRLGRLKMASAYQLLLHTRLVGLGKRFDRSAMMVDQQKARQQQQQQHQAGKQQAQNQKRLDMSSASPETGSVVAPGLHGTPRADAAGIDAITSANAGAAGTPVQRTPQSEAAQTPEAPPVIPVALQQLRSILPGNLEMDASMMEHLARAAVELHHQRTGRKKSADGLLASPLNTAMATNPVTAPSDVAGTSASPPPAAAAEPAAEVAPSKKSSVAWTPAETSAVHKALKEGKDPRTIATTLLPSKTVAQVHAFVKNQQQLAKVNKLQQKQQLGAIKTEGSASKVASSTNTPQQLETGDDSKNNNSNNNVNDKVIATAIASTATSGSSGVPSLPVNIPTAAANSTKGKPTTKTETGTTVAAKGSSSKKAAAAIPKRGGRGRKPPTTAMNTVPNVMMDVRALLQRANNAKNASGETPPTKD